MLLVIVMLFLMGYSPCVKIQKGPSLCNEFGVRSRDLHLNNSLNDSDAGRGSISGREFQFGDDEQVLEMGGGDLCTAT